MTYPKTSKLKPPFEKTDVPGGIAKIVRVWEDLRGRNQDGYVKGGGLLANIRDHGGKSVSRGTTCSPFTATVIGCALDPDYSSKNLDKDVYVPMFSGTSKPLQLPFLDFLHQHNDDNQPIESLVYYELGREIPPTEMRRGDLLAIDWNNDPDPRKCAGHAVYCWDVHLNANGEVDCFQYLGANSSPGLCGVTIGGCGKPDFLTGNPKHGTTPGTLEKAHDPLFVDDDKIVQVGQWLALPDVAQGSIDTDTFRIKPHNLQYKRPSTFTVRKLRVGRLNYPGDPPAPYCMRVGGAPPPKKVVVGHAPAPAQVVKGKDVKKDPGAVEKPAPKAAPQDKDKPLKWQLWVEQAMQQFYRAKWIDSDPGDPDGINDAKTQAAVKEFQKKFDLEVDGIVGKHTRDAIDKHLPCVRQQVFAELMLGNLHRGKQLDSDPGPPDGINNAQTRAALEEFQKKHGLPITGVPDADTLPKLQQVHQGHGATTAQPALLSEPRHLYWLGNSVAPGGSARLRIQYRDLVLGQQCAIRLEDEVSGKQAEASVTLPIEKAENEVSFPVPAQFGADCKLIARVTAAIAGEGELEATTKEPLCVQAPLSGPIAVVDWNDVYLDPPVRLLPQYDSRWGKKAIGRLKSNKLVDWQNNGCNASSAAMILRWFAEDCKAGRLPFPTKSGGSIDGSWYSMRMGEAFWPNFDPPGEVELANDRINFGKVFRVAAHYLKQGEIPRDGKGDASDPPKPHFNYVTTKPKEGWLELIRRMLRMGPVIVGMGPPTTTGHFVVAHGIIDNKLLIVDPGGALWTASGGRKSKHVADWSKKDGYLDGTRDREKVRMPKASQWPGGKPGGQEADARSYNLIWGEFLDAMLDKLISVTSLTYPEGPKFAAAAAPAPAPVEKQSGELEVFFRFEGDVGEKNAARNYTYVAYKVPGKPSAYVLKGRLQVDIDGAPNCYHPKDLNVLKLSQYLTVDLMTYQGALDKKSNGGADDGSWYGMVVDEKTGKPFIQVPNDPCPGFYVSSTSLVDQTRNRSDPRRYVDARRIPYVAFPGHVYAARGPRFTRVGEGPTGELGDFLTVVNPDADEAHRYCHAVFADMGGRDDPHFGEGSPALAQRVHAAGVVEPKLVYIIYPHSGAGRYKIPSLEEIQQQGETLFEAWGGMQEVRRILPLLK